MKVYVLCPPSCHSEIIRKQQCFDVICDVVLEKYKHAWAFNGAIRNTAGPLEFLPEVVSRDTSSKVCFNASRDDITTTEVLNFHKNKTCGSYVSKALAQARLVTSTMWPSAIMCTTASSKNNKTGKTGLMRWEATSVGMLGNWLLLALDWARANCTDRISI